MDRAVAEAVTASSQGGAQLIDHYVPRLVEDGKDQLGLGLDPAGSTIPARRAGAYIALLAIKAPPAAHARRADTEPSCRLTMARAGFYRRDNTAAKLDR